MGRTGCAIRHIAAIARGRGDAALRLRVLLCWMWVDWFHTGLPLA